MNRAEDNERHEVRLQRSTYIRVANSLGIVILVVVGLTVGAFIATIIAVFAGWLPIC